MQKFSYAEKSLNLTREDPKKTKLRVINSGQSLTSSSALKKLGAP